MYCFRLNDSLKRIRIDSLSKMTIINYSSDRELKYYHMPMQAINEKDAFCSRRLS